MMDRGLLSILACPRCKGELSLGPGDKALLCAPCALSYPIRNGIPALLVEEAGVVAAPESEISGERSLEVGDKARFVIVEGKNKGEVVELEPGSCRAVGRSLDDTEKTRVFSVESTLSLDDVSKKMVMNYIAKQFRKKATSSAVSGEALGTFKRKADLYLKDTAVSRLHAMLFYDEGGVGILDLVSKNGTFVNGVEVESKLLQKNDLVTIGTTKFRLE